METGKHYLFTDFGDVFLGEITKDLAVGEIVTVNGVRYKVVGDSGTSRQYHEVYLTEDR